MAGPGRPQPSAMAAGPAGRAGALCKGRGGAGTAAGAAAAAAACPGTATPCGSSRGCGSTPGTGGGRPGPGRRRGAGTAPGLGRGVPVCPRALLTRGQAVFVWGFYGRLPAPAQAGGFQPRGSGSGLAAQGGQTPPRVVAFIANHRDRPPGEVMQTPSLEVVKKTPEYGT